MNNRRRVVTLGSAALCLVFSACSSVRSYSGNDAATDSGRTLDATSDQRLGTGGNTIGTGGNAGGAGSDGTGGVAATGGATGVDSGAGGSSDAGAGSGGLGVGGAGTGGAGTGGATASGGRSGAGGTTATGGGGGAGTSGNTGGRGGAIGTGGATATGGAPGSGGATVTPAMLIIDKASLVFAATPVNVVSAMQSLKITNTGGAAAGTTTPLAAVLEGAQAADFSLQSTSTCSGTLAGGADCLVNVAFKPTSTGAKSATVKISGAAGGTVMATVSGTGTAALTTLSLAPAAGQSADFGTVTIPKTSTRAFVVTNTGTANSAALAISFTANQPFAPSSSASGDCISGVTALTVGASCNLTVEFKPTASGVASSTLSVSAANADAKTLTLSGTGHKAPFLTLAPAAGSSTSFGLIVVYSAKTQTYVLTNTGDDSTPAIQIDLSSDSGFYSLTDATGDCQNGGILDGGASCTLHVLCHPTSSTGLSGTLTATIRLDNVATQSASLTFSGTAVFQ